MIVNIEFLDHEPIENIISSLHFKFDKTIFFGFSEVIEAKKEITKNFLKKYCGVKEVSFICLPEYQWDSILAAMRKVVEQELIRKKEVSFEVTGGESLILIAFGMLAESFKAPMHSFEIETQKLIELNRENITPISEVAPRQHIQLDHFGIFPANMEKNGTFLRIFFAAAVDLMQIYWWMLPENR